jgi:hypothetical protein
MLDPHIRTALPPVPGTLGTYSVTFRAPDRHGVYKFVIDYKRNGYEPTMMVREQVTYKHLPQMVFPSKFDNGPCRSTPSRRIPPLPQRSVAVLRRGHQHECGFRGIFRFVLGWGRSRAQEDQRPEVGVKILPSKPAGYIRNLQTPDISCTSSLELASSRFVNCPMY